jgi:replicative DNA helicase
MAWKPQKQALSYLIEQMRRDRKFVLLTAGLSEAADSISAEDADSMEQAMQAALVKSRLETSEALDNDFTQSGETISTRLHERMDNPGMLRGISTGFHGIDYVTGGLQPEQFVVLIGTPKSFKSATLLAMAKAVHAQAKIPLFIGFEMSNIEQEDRLTSLLAGVSLSKILSGKLSIKEFKSIETALRQVEAMRSFLFSTDISSATTVSGVQAKMQNYLPDVVFIDGAYLMDADLGPNVEKGSPQALTAISRGLKRLAQSTKTPIVVTTQASLVRSKNGLTLGSGMYTQAWGQDCDVFLGVERMTTQDGEVDEAGEALVKFRVIESRSGPRKDTLLLWDWAHGDVKELDPEEIRAKLDNRKARAQAQHSAWSGDDGP